MHNQPLYIQPKRSLFFSGIVLFLTVDAITGLFFCQFNFLLKFGLCFLCMICVWHLCQRHLLLRHPKSIMSLMALPNNQWQLVLGSGESITADLKPHLLVSRLLLVLSFKIAHKKFPITVLLFFDALPLSTRLTLRTRLLMLTGFY